MDQQDLKQIKEVFKEGLREEFPKAFREGFTEVWEGNLEPSFNVVHERVDKLTDRVDKLTDLVSQLPTKSYFDDKFGDISGDLITKLRKEDQKLNRLLEMLKQRNLLSERELQELAALQIFPKQT